VEKTFYPPLIPQFLNTHLSNPTIREHFVPRNSPPFSINKPLLSQGVTPLVAEYSTEKTQVMKNDSDDVDEMNISLLPVPSRPQLPGGVKTEDRPPKITQTPPQTL